MMMMICKIKFYLPLKLEVIFMIACQVAQAVCNW